MPQKTPMGCGQPPRELCNHRFASPTPEINKWVGLACWQLAVFQGMRLASEMSPASEGRGAG